ncbi:MAG: phosphoribosylanthranilate isomerase, partial [Desulfovibrionaceae bacterium]|nr:phosphoribosylanthranilate isomerase [Desulfovibrionaceae bacterium]
MNAPVLVKVCGLTRREDAAACRELGVDLTGFIFAAGSPRRVTPETVRDIARDTPESAALRVGVFAEQTAGEVIDIMDHAGLDLAQLHGDASPDFCRAVGAERVIRVFWPQRHATRLALEAELALFSGACRLLLLD